MYGAMVRRAKKAERKGILLSFFFIYWVLKSFFFSIFVRFNLKARMGKSVFSDMIS